MTDEECLRSLQSVNKSGKVSQNKYVHCAEKNGEGTEGIVCKVMKNQDPNNIKVVKIKKDTCLLPKECKEYIWFGEVRVGTTLKIKKNGKDERSLHQYAGEQNGVQFVVMDMLMIRIFQLSNRMMKCIWCNFLLKHAKEIQAVQGGVYSSRY